MSTVISLRWWTDSTSLLQQSTFPRCFVALVLGVCVGAERQWRQRSAGLRTNTLVCLGSAAFVDLGLTIAPNTTQVVAYVVSGVGFLGAGAIMKDGGNVKGLNTAATLWCSAAVGACAGAGELLDAVFVTVLLISVNSLLRPISRFIDRRSLAVVSHQAFYRLRVVCDTKQEGEAGRLLTRSIKQHTLVLRELRSEPIEGTGTMLFQVIVESSTRDGNRLNALAEDLRQESWTESVDCTEADSDSE